MKVKELIEELKKLDQDKGIWIVYDGGNESDYGYAAGIYDPFPDKKPCLKPLAEYAQWYEEEIKVGDYVISVG